MDSTVASNAVVAMVGMYAQALAEKDREKQELREQVRQREDTVDDHEKLSAKIARALEAATPGLQVTDYGTVAQLAVTAIREGRGLLEQVMQQRDSIDRAKGALRELGKAVFPAMPGVAPDDLLPLIVGVVKEVVDLHANMKGLKAEVQAFTGRAYDPDHVALVWKLVQAARAFGKVPGAADGTPVMMAADALAQYERENKIT